MSGGGGDDAFVFAPGFGKNTIQDFATGQDVIQIDHSLFGNFKAILANTHDDLHGNTVIAYDPNNTITLLGVTKANLHAYDFHIV